MTPEPSEPTASADQLGPSRRRVLAFLQQSAAPASVEEVASALELHANTVRFHLGALRADGLIARVTETRSVQGRPRDLYSAVPEAPTVFGDHYRDLAMALTSFVATTLPNPPQAALQAGTAWGRRIAEAQPPSGDGLEDLEDTVNAMGFSSRMVAGEATTTLEITRCPYRELALAEQDVVGGLHAGMMRGYLDAGGSPYEMTTLDPWVQPSLCLARFVKRHDD